MLTDRWSYLKRSRNTLVADEVVVIACLTLLVLYLGHLLSHEGRGEVGEEEQFVVCYLCELLHELYEVIVLDVDSTTIAHHYESGVELSDLV